MPDEQQLHEAERLGPAPPVPESGARRLVGLAAIDLGPLRRHRDYRLLSFGQAVSFFGSVIAYVASRSRLPPDGLDARGRPARPRRARAAAPVGVRRRCARGRGRPAAAWCGSRSSGWRRARPSCSRTRCWRPAGVGAVRRRGARGRPRRPPAAVARRAHAAPRRPRGADRRRRARLAPLHARHDRRPGDRRRADRGVRPAVRRTASTSRPSPSRWSRSARCERCHRRPTPSRRACARIARGLPLRAQPRGAVGTYSVDIVAMFFGMPTALFPALAAELGGPGVLGLLYAAPSVGSLIATLTSGWTARVHRHGLAVIVAAAGWGVGIVAVGLAPNVALALRRPRGGGRGRHAQRHLPLDDLEPDDPRPAARTARGDRADQLLDRPAARRRRGRRRRLARRACARRSSRAACSASSASASQPSCCRRSATTTRGRSFPSPRRRACLVDCAVPLEAPAPRTTSRPSGGRRSLGDS